MNEIVDKTLMPSHVISKMIYYARNGIIDGSFSLPNNVKQKSNVTGGVYVNVFLNRVCSGCTIRSELVYESIDNTVFYSEIKDINVSSTSK